METVSALSLSEGPDDFFQKLLSLRYGGAVHSYVTRNHFPELDWIPNNEKAGNLRDVTSELARASHVKVQTGTKDIYKNKWLADRVKAGEVSRELASLAHDRWDDPVKAKIPYISLENARVALRKARTGTIVNVVREDNENFPLMVSHQAFVVQENGHTYLRYASRGKDVKTEKMDSFLKSLKKWEVWKVVGLNFNRLGGK